MPVRKWRGNTRRENRLEELGRVDAEKAYTKKGKRNLRDEKSRIRKELAGGGISFDRKDFKNPPLQIIIEDPPRRKKRPPEAARPKGIRKEVGPRGGKGLGRESMRDRLRKFTQKGKQSPGRPGGKGPKPDKRWNKGDKFMTPLRKKLKDGSRPRPQGPQTWVKSGIPKLAKKGWK
jgi:hypothetical protein